MITVLHLLSAAGGGTERFVRELAEGLPSVRHLLLQLGANEGAVLEDPAQGRHVLLRDGAVDRRRVLGLLDRYGVDLVHLHWIGPATLPWMLQVLAAGRPFLVSLHDIGFLRGAVFDDAQDPLTADPDWIAAWQPVWQAARVVTSPSAFIDTQFARLQTGQVPHRVAPGLADPTPVVEQALAELPTVGVVGALGPHKGSELLDAVLAASADRTIRYVLIGYQDRQLYPGTRHDGRLTVHGPYLSGEAPSLIDRYRVDLLWFPNRMPESFSYALSEAWAAARPVLVPDAGALGERVGAMGGGWMLRQPADPSSVLADLGEYLPIARDAGFRADLRRERQRRVPSLLSMLKTMQDLYDSLPTDTGQREPWADGELAEQLAEQLGPLRFRHENIRLARDYAQARDWIAHLEADLKQLRDGHDTERHALRLELERRDDRIAQLQRCLAEQAEADHARAEALRSALEHSQAQLTALQARLDALQAEWRQQSDRQMEQQRIDRERLAERDAALADQQGQLAALWSERAVLSIKAYRYDRVLGLIPAPLLRRLRGLLQRLRGTR